MVELLVGAARGGATGRFDPSDNLVAIPDEQRFSCANQSKVVAQPVFELGDVDGFHGYKVAISCGLLKLFFTGRYYPWTVAVDHEYLRQRWYMEVGSGINVIVPMVVLIDSP
jgi:hypothetical protein